MAHRHAQLRNRQTDRQEKADRQKQTDRQTDTRTDGQTDRQAEYIDRQKKQNKIKRNEMK